MLFFAPGVPPGSPERPVRLVRAARRLRAVQAARQSPGHPERRRTENDVCCYCSSGSGPSAGRENPPCAPVRKKTGYAGPAHVKSMPTTVARNTVGQARGTSARWSGHGTTTAKRTRNTTPRIHSGDANRDRCAANVSGDDRDLDGHRCDTCVPDGIQQRRTCCKNQRNYSRLLLDVRKLPTVISLVSVITHRLQAMNRATTGAIGLRTDVRHARSGRPPGRPPRNTRGKTGTTHHECTTTCTAACTTTCTAACGDMWRHARRQDGFTTVLPSPGRPRGTPPSA